ncbi:MAG TPA: methylamine utilization protein [Rhodanobacter sp.]|nr:methylamine utilization protein [Rhodanobacter sp.]
MFVLRLFGVAWLSLGLAAPVAAATVTMHVSDQQGHAVSDAVVTLTLDGAAANTLPAGPSKLYYIDQKDETFIPYVQIFRPGDKVVFRNSDTTRHQVYSFSSIKRFEFVLRPGEHSPALELDKTGVAAVGCNIHDDMITYLFVSAAANIAMSDRAGNVSFGQLAPGRYTLRLWHPQLHPGEPEPEQQLTIASMDEARQLAISLSLMPDPRGPMVHEQSAY